MRRRESFKLLNKTAITAKSFLHPIVEETVVILDLIKANDFIV